MSIGMNDGKVSKDFTFQKWKNHKISSFHRTQSSLELQVKSIENTIIMYEKQLEDTKKDLVNTLKSLKSLKLGSLIEKQFEEEKRLAEKRFHENNQFYDCGHYGLKTDSDCWICEEADRE